MHFSVILVLLLFMADVFYKLGCFTLFKPINVSIVVVGFLSIYLFFISPKNFLFVLCLILFEIALRLPVIDFMSDSLTYHHPARQFIKNGGNLFFGREGDIRIDSMPTLPWVATAVVMKVFPIHTLYSFGTISLSISFFFYLKNNFSIIQGSIFKILGCFCIAFPTLFWVQVYGGYTDYYTYLFVSWSIFSFIECYKTPNKYTIFVFLVVFSTALTSKYTSLVFASLIFIPLFVFCAFQKQAKLKGVSKILSIKALIIILACCFSVTWTYGQNLVFHEYPFPVNSEKFYYGSEKEHLSEIDFFKEKSIPESAFYSLFSSTGAVPEKSYLKLPGLISFQELKTLGNPANRFGGSGPWFSLVLLVSLIFYLVNFRKNKLGYFDYVILSILFITFFFPGAWQVRYFPLIQLFPLLVMIKLMGDGLKKIILVLAGANIILCLVFSSIIQVYKTYTLINFSQDIEEKVYFEFNGHHYNRRIFEILGIQMHQKRLPNTSCEGLRAKYGVLVHPEVDICEHQKIHPKTY